MQEMYQTGDDSIFAACRPTVTPVWTSEAYYTYLVVDIGRPKDLLANNDVWKRTSCARPRIVKNHGT